MFSLRRPTEAEVQEQLRRARGLPASYGLDLRTEGGREQVICPRGFALDYHRSQIGQGQAAFTAAKEAFRRWLQFDLGWVRIANPQAPIEQGEVVAVEAHSLWLWSINISRILYVIDEEDRFGFGYGTTAMHVERGEERFLIEYYPISGAVFYDLLAVSQPAHWLVRLGYFFTRSQQHRFARDSLQRMRRSIQDSSSNPQ
ncbi:DUF1990 family protein [Acidicapsa dinghuensis]|uniref:DUF1990 family protein n=1 Tax=Acidicapsa dinghuensis TaxID=2218256 RepID=A0ABW1EJR9_9BACT|nr:DUF1990 domain-containing protein [Acidicapsa dinghuensis]